MYAGMIHGGQRHNVLDRAKERARCLLCGRLLSAGAA